DSDSVPSSLPCASAPARQYRRLVRPLAVLPGSKLRFGASHLTQVRSWNSGPSCAARHGNQGRQSEMASPFYTSEHEAYREVVREILSGNKISALAITEPSGGSDVANLRTSARRDGDFYVVNGEKTFITSGMRADYITTAVRTGGPGPGGVSLLVIEGDTPGLSRTPLKKMGWWASDTATLHFDDCRVPAGNLLGEEGRGFKIIMHNFNGQRLTMAAGCTAAARVCLEEAMEYAKQRHTYGTPVAQHQVNL